MTTPQTFELAGHRWQVEPLGVQAQIEVEFIFLRMFGPGMAGAASAAVDTLAGPIVAVLRKQAERPDLAALAEKDLGSTEVKEVWGELLGELQSAALEAIDALVHAAGEAVRVGIPEITDRLRHKDIIRLFELALFAHRCYVVPSTGQAGDVCTWAVLDRLLTEPQAKYRLLIKALGVTYGVAPVEAVTPVEGEGA